MNSLVLTEAANEDINEIWSRVSADSIETADEVEAVIIQNCELLTQLPSLGRKRPDLTNRELLFWPASPYMNYYIVYAVRPDHVRIVRVIHAARRRVWKAL